MWSIWSIQENVWCILEKNVYSAALEWSVLWMSIRSSCFIVLSSLFFINLMSRCSIHYWNGGIEVSNYYRMISPFNFSCQCFLHIFLSLSFGVRILSLLCLLDELTLLLIQNISPSLSLVTISYLQSVLSVTSIVTSALFWLLFVSFLFQPIVPLDHKWISCR